jgi:hypothetical protein
LARRLVGEVDEVICAVAGRLGGAEQNLAVGEQQRASLLEFLVADEELDTVTLP